MAADSTPPRRVRVWDLPTRICHWALAASCIAAFVTGFIGGRLMELHGKAGLAVIGLVVFRIVWGFAGSTHARFASFVRGPAAVRAYLRGEWRGVGHNPLGAFSVLGLLALAAFQVACGLFGNDDISFNGPLYPLVSKETSDFLTGLHSQSAWLLLALVGVHLAAIAYYVRIKKDNLVLPMLTGWKDAAAGDSARGGGIVAFIVAVAIALGAVWAASGRMLPPPAPQAATTTPAW
jgi:cytochrome b